MWVSPRDITHWQRFLRRRFKWASKKDQNGYKRANGGQVYVNKNKMIEIVIYLPLANDFDLVNSFYKKWKTFNNIYK